MENKLNGNVYTVTTGQGDKSFIASSIFTCPLSGETILYDSEGYPSGVIPKGFLIILGRFLPSPDREIKDLQREEVEKPKNKISRIFTKIKNIFKDETNERWQQTMKERLERSKINEKE